MQPVVCLPAMAAKSVSTTLACWSDRDHWFMVVESPYCGADTLVCDRSLSASCRSRSVLTISFVVIDLMHGKGFSPTQLVSSKVDNRSQLPGTELCHVLLLIGNLLLLARPGFVCSDKQLFSFSTGFFFLLEVSFSLVPPLIASLEMSPTHLSKRGGQPTSRRRLWSHTGIKLHLDHTRSDLRRSVSTYSFHLEICINSSKILLYVTLFWDVDLLCNFCQSGTSRWTHTNHTRSLLQMMRRGGFRESWGWPFAKRFRIRTVHAE